MIIFGNGTNVTLETFITLKSINTKRVSKHFLLLSLLNVCLFMGALMLIRSGGQHNFWHDFENACIRIRHTISTEKSTIDNLSPLSYTLTWRFFVFVGWLLLVLLLFLYFCGRFTIKNFTFILNHCLPFHIKTSRWMCECVCELRLDGFLAFHTKMVMDWEWHSHTDQNVTRL